MDEAYLLPRRAILPDGSVYVAEEGKLRRRKVKVARWTGEEVMLLPGGGVAEGDRVIVGYVPKPVLGMAVRAVDSLGEASKPPPASGPATLPGGDGS